MSQFFRLGLFIEDAYKNKIVLFYSMILALTSAELGVNSFTINLILLTAIVVLLALPTFFLFKSSQGKSAVSKKTEVENIESENIEQKKLELNLVFKLVKSIKTNIIKLSNLFPTPLITLVCINNQPIKRIPLYALTNEKISF